MSKREEQKKETHRLAIIAKNGSEKDVERLLYSVEGLVVKAAADASKIYNTEREELKSHARMYVLEALQKFDPERDNSDFFGLCALHIKGGMYEYTNRSSRVVSYSKSRRDDNAVTKLGKFITEKEKEGFNISEIYTLAAKEFRIKECDVGTLANMSSYESDEDSFLGFCTEKDGYKELEQNQTNSHLESILKDLNEVNRYIFESKVLNKCENNESDSARHIAEKLNVALETDKYNRHNVMIIYKETIIMLRDKFEENGISLEDLV